MQFRRAQAVCAEPEPSFQRLNTSERRTLTGWITRSRPAGIETVEDLGVRDWPDLRAENIIGVFKTGHLLASWLIVGQAGSWAVASCADGAVSQRMASLEDALALVYPPQRHIPQPHSISSRSRRPTP